MKWVVTIFFIAIVASLAGALFFMMRRSPEDGEAKGNRMATALALRIGLSVGLFLILLLAYFLGWIEPTGIRAGQ